MGGTGGDGDAAPATTPQGSFLFRAGRGFLGGFGLSWGQEGRDLSPSGCWEGTCGTGRLGTRGWVLRGAMVVLSSLGLLMSRWDSWLLGGCSRFPS